jgi:hypothetical protein
MTPAGKKLCPCWLEEAGFAIAPADRLLHTASAHLGPAVRNPWTHGRLQASIKGSRSPICSLRQV